MSATTADATRSRRGGRRRARRRRLQLSVAIATVAAVGGVFAPGAPTGLDGLDAAYQAVYAFGVTMACAQARRWTWPIVAGGALLGGAADVWTVGAAVALALAVWAQVDSRRRQPVGAVIGALSAQALLRLPPLLAWGVPSLIAFLAPLPAVVVAFTVLRSRNKRTATRALLAAGGATIVIAAVFGVGALLIRSDASTGAQAAKLGLDALRNGDQATARGHFGRSTRAFDAANDTANAWWMTPARALPVVSQHVEAAKVLTREGRRVAATATEAAPAVSLDDLRAPGGRIRIDRIVELQPLTRDVVATFEAALAGLDELDDGWLTAPMNDATATLRTEVDDALPDARLAVDALELAPDLLGDGGTARYLVLFGNPAEAREMGGFVASIGLLTATDGALAFDGLGGPSGLEDELAAAGATLGVEAPTPYVNAQPQRFVRNWTDSPDIDTVTAVAADLYPQAASGAEIDGVLYLDTAAVAALLELTGPVRLPETGEVLDAETADEYLQRGQYLDEGFVPGQERKDRLAQAGEIAFERLIADLPDPRTIADSLAPVVQGRRLLFSTVDTGPHALLREIGLRPLMAPEPAPELLDNVLVTHGARRAHKLDAYLERSITYEAEIADDGTVDATATVTLTNTAPAQGLADYQIGSAETEAPGRSPVNAVALSLYSLLDLDEVMVDDRAAPVSVAEAYGLGQYTVPVDVPAGDSVAVTFQLRGVHPSNHCELRVTPNGASWTDPFSLVTMRHGTVETVEEQPLDRVIVTPC